MRHLIRNEYDQLGSSVFRRAAVTSDLGLCNRPDKRLIASVDNLYQVIPVQDLSPSTNGKRVAWMTISSTPWSKCRLWLKGCKNHILRNRVPVFFCSSGRRNMTC